MALPCWEKKLCIRAFSTPSCQGKSRRAPCRNGPSAAVDNSHRMRVQSIFVRAPSRRPRFFSKPRTPCLMSTASFWPSCLEAFRRELTPQQFNTWIRPLRLEHAGEGLVLIAPNRFVLQWVKERFAGRIEELATVALG